MNETSGLSVAQNEVGKQGPSSYAFNFKATPWEQKSSGLDWAVGEQVASSLSDGVVELVIGVNNRKANSFLGLSGIIDKHSGKITDVISMGQNQAVVLNVPAKAASALALEVGASGFSRYVEPDIKYKVDVVPNDSYWSLQWGPKKIQADAAWDTTTGNLSILVAVVDTGIDYNHPDIVANYVPLGYDWVNNDAYPLDDNGHGTHCAGIIAATLNNGLGIAGIAQVRIMAEKGLGADGTGGSSALANAITHAVNQGAKIISNSWGSNQSSSLIQDAIAYANSQGVLVLAAAGNTGTNEVHYPGAYPEVVAVTATDSADAIASFSTYGSWVDVAAPGVSIYATMPTYGVTLNNPPYSLPRSYSYMSGTSMACPHAAGVAALIWSRFPEMSAKFVRYQLETTCVDLGATGFDIYYGNGRINAKTAVEQAPPSHDVVAYSLQAPAYLKLGNTGLFNATIMNRGISNEVNVQLNLLANNTLVNSTTVSSLNSLAEANRTLSWTPVTVGKYNVTFSITPVPGETIIENNAIATNVTVVFPPDESNWTTIATDPDEGTGSNLKTAYSQSQSNIAFLKVDFYRSWTDPNGIDTAIFIDADQNPRTGLPEGLYTNQKTSIGADYLIVVGAEGPQIWKWNPTLGFFDANNPFELAYLDLPSSASSFTVGIKLADVDANGNFDCVFCDAYSNWDWMPNNGYRPFISNKYTHEVAVTLETPKGLQPGETTVLTATMFNFGVNNETNLNLEILINGTVIASGTVAQLASGASHQVTYSWTPTIEAKYNITAYAAPQLGETVYANNVRTRIASVTYKVALISDYSELLGAIGILDSMYINYDAYYNNYVYLYTSNLSLLSGYRGVIFYNDDRNISSAEQTALNAYLSAGGNLLVTGYDSLGHPDDSRLANVVRSSTFGDNVGEIDLYVVNSSHPVMSGPLGSFPSGYHISGLFSDADAAQADVARHAQTIAELADGYDKIIATQGLPGKVVYWNGDGLSDWLSNVDCMVMLKNTLIWFMDTTPPVTVDDYDGLWHTSDFIINLVANDYFGVSQIYYRINGGSTLSVGVDGQPQITTEGGSNMLEYWSADLMGNQELPHKMLTQIKLDRTPPSGTIQINSGSVYATSPAVTLSLTASDAVSGISQVRFSNDGVWDTESWESLTPATPWVLTSGDGTKTVYYQIKNNAGLTATYIATITLDTAPPTGTISINNGATYSTTPTVDIALALTDATSGVARMRFSNDNSTWSTWETYATLKTWTLDAGDGAKTVFAQVSDNAGLISSFSDLIIVDTTVPTAHAGQTQTVTQGSKVTFDASASTDSSGIISYTWDFGDGSQGSGVIATHTYSTSGTYTAKLTVQDAAGNTATAQVNVIIEPAPTPTPNPTPNQTTAATSQPTATPRPNPTPTATPSPAVTPSQTVSPTPPQPSNTTQPTTEEPTTTIVMLAVIAVLLVIGAAGVFLRLKRK
ncbi:MAG: S8 family serine peptidase [Candidatus Bathyarchaeota archaeon]|nr:S8 family serine peptidase [Candidatus Bathyarchaeota archaeon]